MSDDMSEERDPGELLVLQHDRRVGLDALAEMIAGRRGTRPVRTAVVVDDGLPGLSRRTRGVVVLGGPMGVADRHEHDWLEEELWLIRGAVGAGVPIFGICLGAQLLATALGGEVERRHSPRVGYLPLTRTDAAADDEVFAGWPDGGRALFLHRDEITTLPADAVPMLTTDGAVVAWRMESQPAYAVQFHPEVTASQVAAWSDDPDFRDIFDAYHGPLPELLATVESQNRFSQPLGVALVGRFLDGVVGADDPTPEVTPRPELVEQRRRQRAEQRDAEPTSSPRS